MRPGQNPLWTLADDLFRFMRSNVTPSKAPKIMDFVAELPKTISGKIRRVELRSKEAQTRAGTATSPEEYFYQELRKG